MKPNTRRAKTITVGIPAFNEEYNIRVLLTALLAQTLENASLENIIVVADGCTDRTAEIVRSINDHRITLIEYHERRGMTIGQNDIVRRAETDILVMLDADVIPASETFLQEMVRPFNNDERVGLVGADVVSTQGNNRFEKILATSHALKNHIYNQINGGDNIYMCHGRARAFGKELYKMIHWPPTYPEDSFSYLFCIERGFRFVHTSRATVLFRSPASFRDHLKQSVRYAKGKKIVRAFFPPRVVKKHYRIPLGISLKSVLHFLKRQPVSIISYLGLLVAIRCIGLFTPAPPQTLYDPSLSSKKVTP